MAVEGDFSGEGGRIGQEIGDLFGQQDPVGEESYQEPFSLRVGVDVQEIFPEENFPAGEEEPQTPGFGDFVEDAAVFFEG